MEQRSDRAQRDHVRRGEDRIEIDLPRDKRIDRGLGEFDLDMTRDDHHPIDRQHTLVARTQTALLPRYDHGHPDVAQHRDPPSPQPYRLHARAPAPPPLSDTHRAKTELKP